MSEELECPHLNQVYVLRPSNVEGCVDCLKTGDSWVHLRICKKCGYVGCCDNSKNKHMTAHNKSSSHPIIQSVQPDEYWMWCYDCNVGWTMNYFKAE